MTVTVRQADQWSETAYQLLVAAYLAAGDLVNAQRSLRQCHAMLRDLGLPADPTTIALGQRLRGDR